MQRLTVSSFAFTTFRAARWALGIIVAGASIAPAFSAILTFEDIAVPPGAFGVATIPAGYHGLNWSNQWSVSTTSSSWFVPVPTLPSGQNYAWSSGANDIAIDGATFDFASAWIASAFFGNTGQAIAHGFIGNSEVFTRSFTANTTMQLFTFNFAGINRLTFTDQHGNLVLDDLNITIRPSGVPEPATAALLGLGLIGLVASRRRKLN